MFISKVQLVVVADLIGLAHAASDTNLANAYAPVRVQCPRDVKLYRPADGLLKAEADWVYARKRVVTDALAGYLMRLELEDFDVWDYIHCLKNSNYSHTPVMGLAISGGGSGSAYTGTGALRALDSRLCAANEQKTGGLLQSMTYMSGQSGGGWPIMSFAQNNFPTADEILDIWRPEFDRFGAENTTQYAADPEDIIKQIIPKLGAGFNLTFSDYEGRATAYELVPGPLGGLNVTYSGVRNLSKFVNHQMPFPIIQVAEVIPGDAKYYNVSVPYANSTLYDMTPFEFGAWYGPTTGYTPMEWLGTSVINGSAVNSSACLKGFDNAGFIIGTAASAWNFWYIEAKSNGTLAAFSKRSTTEKSVKKRELSFSLEDLLSNAELYEKYLRDTSFEEISVAIVPNPYFGLPSADLSKRTRSDLTLVDATEVGQAIPFWGQINPARGSSFIIGWDDDGDQAPYNWNNGTNMYGTYLQANASGIPFPVVPPATTFINRNYTINPVFFGCDAELTTTKDLRSPIVLYLANSPYSAYENYTFTQASFVRGQMYDIFENSFNILTQGNGTLDKEWPACLGCAAIDRSLAKVGWTRTAQCQRCMEKYCWDGKEDNTPITKVFDPSLKLNPSLSFAEWNKTHPF